jgi:Polysaccharide deacetylase
MSTRTGRSLRSRLALPLASVAVAVPLLILAAQSADAREPGPGSPAESSADASPKQTVEPTPSLTASPTPSPTPRPRQKRTPPPTGSAEPRPTASRTAQPTHDPTDEPTTDPTTIATRTSTPVTLSPSRTPAPRPPTVVTLDFDSNTVDQLAAANLLQSLGIRAVFYVNSGRLDVGGDYMSTAQVRALQARGHEIGGHTVSQAHLSQLDQAEQQRQICADRVRLLSAGLTVSTFAYPFGENDPAAQNAARQCGYNNARTFGGLSCRGCDAAETVPPASVYSTRSVSGIDRGTTAGQLMVAVQRAQATGGWLQLVFQRVCASAACVSNGIARPEFDSFARWLDGQRRDGALTISTVHDVLGGNLRPAVAAPAATATSLRIANSSFETAGSISDGAATSDVAQCFTTSTNGDGNVFAARRVSDRHSGSWAQEVVVAKVSGAVKLQSAQDLGSCAPPIASQHTYRISVWYKSSAPVVLAAYTRRPTGGYSAFGTSPTFPATNRWSRAVWTTKGAPATPNLALSVGAVFKQPGTYILDDFGVADAGLAARAEAQASLVETDSRESIGQGPDGLFIPSDTAPTIPAGPAAVSLKANQRHGWLLTLEVCGALILMWGLFALLDRRFRYIHRRTRTRAPAHR